MKTAKGEESRLDMTPMIDLIFQLLIFFIISMRPEEMLAGFDVVTAQRRRPPDPGDTTQEPGGRAVEIRISRTGLAMDGKGVSEQEVAGTLRKLVLRTPGQQIIVGSEQDVAHERLIGVLDLCASVGVTNLALTRL